MRYFFEKLAFAHRRLWQRDGLYRMALFFGPAPILGCALGYALWGGVTAFQEATYRPPQWAVPQGPEHWNVDGEVQSVRPSAPLPETDANGEFIGYVSGWNVTAEPIQVNAELDVDLIPSPLASFFLSENNINMGQIISAGPASSLYVAVGSGLLAIRTAGIYNLSARFGRPAAPAADCLIRLGFDSRRIISTLEVGVINDVSQTFDPAQFTLQPGLYPIHWAFGCWHGQQVIGPGQLTLLLGHPGNPTLLPAASDEILRQQ